VQLLETCPARSPGRSCKCDIVGVAHTEHIAHLGYPQQHSWTTPQPVELEHTHQWIGDTCRICGIIVPDRLGGHR